MWGMKCEVSFTWEDVSLSEFSSCCRFLLLLLLLTKLLIKFSVSILDLIFHNKSCRERTQEIQTATAFVYYLLDSVCMFRSIMSLSRKFCLACVKVSRQSFNKWQRSKYSHTFVGVCRHWLFTDSFLAWLFPLIYLCRLYSAEHCRINLQQLQTQFYLQ